MTTATATATGTTIPTTTQGNVGPSSLNMALDDVIKENRQSNQRRKNQMSDRRRNRGSLSSSSRRDMMMMVDQRRDSRRYGNDSRRHDRRRSDGIILPSASNNYGDNRRRQLPSFSSSQYRQEPQEPTGSKILISNLNPSVTKPDIQELFQSVGSLQRVRLFYDKNGRNSGEAEVIFDDRNDARVAMDRFHHVPLDGFSMQISIPSSSSSDSYRSSRLPHSTPRRQHQQSHRRRSPAPHHRPRGGSRSMDMDGSSNRGDSNNNSKPRTQIDSNQLDNDLDNYMMSA